MEALAAALAHISGATSVDQHSLINSEAGFVTMILWCSIEMPNISYAWKELKEQLGEDIDSKVKGMVLKESRVFAIPTASVTEVQEKWHDSQRWHSDQEVATKVTDSKTKARSRVLIRHLDSNLK